MNLVRFALVLLLAAGLFFTTGCGFIGVIPLGGAIVGVVVATSDDDTTVEEEEPEPTDVEISGVYPPAGPTAGGTEVHVFGNRFVTGVVVNFDGNPATSMVVVSSVEITCLTPGVSTAGVVDVVVQNLVGPPATLTGGFTYDDTAPGSVTGFSAVETAIGEATLTWSNPADADFAGVSIRRATTGYPADCTAGDFAYDGTAETHPESELTPGETYYYSAFAYDEAGNYSAGAQAQVTLNIPPSVTANLTLYSSQAPEGAVVFSALCTDIDGSISTTTGVTIDLTPIGGSSSQAMFDDGSNGDFIGNDDIFTCVVQVDAATTQGLKSLTITAKDDDAAQATGMVELDVNDLLLIIPNQQADDMGAGPQNDSTMPQMAFSGYAVYVVWQEKVGTVNAIYFSRSWNLGQTWDPPVQISGATGMTAGRPKIACQGNTIYVVWEGQSAAGDWDIYFNLSLNWGLNWMVPTRVDTAAATFNARKPCMAFSGDNVYVAWEDYRILNASSEIYFNYSIDGGASWNAPDQCISNNGMGSQVHDPRICCSGACVYVGWSDNRNGTGDIYFNKSWDGGASFSGFDTRVDKSNPSPGDSKDLALACAGEAVYAVYRDDRNGDYEVFLNASMNGGTNWGLSDRKLETDSTVNEAGAPQLKVEGNLLYVTWTDLRNGLRDVFFQASVDAGATWLSSDVRINTNAAGDSDSTTPALASSGEYVYVVFADDRYTLTDIFVNFSTDAGQTWLSRDVRLDTSLPNTSASTSPCVALNGHNLYVLWQDDIDLDSQQDLRFQWGQYRWAPTVGASDVRLNTNTAATSSSNNVRIAASGNYLYAVWEDWRNGNGDIFFNFSKDGGVTWEANDIRVDNDSNNFNAVCPAIGCVGKMVAVVWEDWRSTTADIYYNVSHDNGATWSGSDVQLDSDISPTTWNARTPQITADGSYVYVSWSDDRNSPETHIWSNASSNGGMTWQGEMQVDKPAGPSSAFSGKMCCFGKNAWIVWQDTRNGLGDIYYNVTNDAGMTWWAPDIQLYASPAGCRASAPSIANQGQLLYVAWQDNRNDTTTFTTDIYMKFTFVGISGAATWGPDTRLDTGDALQNYSFDPRVACSGQSVYVVWSDERNSTTGIEDIYLNSSNDFGQTWAGDVMIETDTAGANDSYEARVFVQGTSVFVTWEDDRSGDTRLYMNYSLDGATNWLTSDLRLDNNSNSGTDSSVHSALMCGNRFFAAWSDDRPGGLFTDIYGNRVD